MAQGDDDLGPAARVGRVDHRTVHGDGGQPATTRQIDAAAEHLGEELFLAGGNDGLVSARGLFSDRGRRSEKQPQEPRGLQNAALGHPTLPANFTATMIQQNSEDHENTR